MNIMMSQTLSGAQIGIPSREKNVEFVWGSFRAQKKAQPVSPFFAVHVLKKSFSDIMCHGEVLEEFYSTEEEEEVEEKCRY